MKKSIWNKIGIICCVVIVTGCKPKKLIVVNRPVKDTAVVKVNDNNESKLAAIRSKQVTFNTFSGRAKTKLDINGNDNDVTLNIRISRDHRIWISVTAIAGIEVARAQITPDSIQVINRLQSVYLKKPFSFIYNYASRQINYKTLESLLVGNAMPELLNHSTVMQPDNDNTSLSGNLQGLIYKLLLGADLKVSRLNLTDQAAGQTLQVNNGMFIQTTERVIPSQINISSSAPGNKINLNLRYTRADFDVPLEFPFSIPKSYQPAN